MNQSTQQKELFNALGKEIYFISLPKSINKQTKPKQPECIKILKPEEDRVIRDIERINLMLTILEQTETLSIATHSISCEILNDIVKELRSCLK